MKTKTIWGFIIGWVCIWIVAWAGYSARAQPLHQPQTVHAVRPIAGDIVIRVPVLPDPPPPASVPSPDLQNYLEASMLTWSPPREHVAALPHETEEQYRARVHDIARDIAAVAGTEPPILADAPRSSILLAAVAFWESRFFAYVDRGLCNDMSWVRTTEGRRATMAANCDGGLAATMWQLHTEEGGLLLHDDGGVSTGWSGRSDGMRVNQIMLIEDRELSARVAWRMLRQSMVRTGRLAGFTGEGSSAPKAAARLNFARSWSASHPFTAGK